MDAVQDVLYQEAQKGMETASTENISKGRICFQINTLYAVQDVSHEEAKKAWDLSHPEPINVWLDRVTLPASFKNTSRPSIFVEFLNDQVSSVAHTQECAPARATPVGF